MSKARLNLVGKAVLWGLAAVGLVATVLVVGILFVSTQIDHPPSLQTQAQSMQIVSALEFYRLDNGQYPNSEQGLEALIASPTSPPAPKAYPDRGYLKNPEMILDRWRRPFFYESDGVFFRLVSLGADGKRGGSGADSDIIEESGSP